MQVRNGKDYGSGIVLGMKSPAQIFVEELWEKAYPWVVCAVIGSVGLGTVYLSQVASAS